VEIEDAFATDVAFGFMHYSESAYYVDFDGVPVEKLDLIRAKLLDALKQHVTSGVDMERMQLVIARDRLKLLDAIETDPPNFFVQ
jgi:hypothetical protein